MLICWFVKAKSGEDICGYCGSTARGEVHRVYGHTARYMRCNDDRGTCCWQATKRQAAMLDPDFEGAPND